jgi:hypothetical protein
MRMTYRFWLVKGLLFLALAVMSGYRNAHYPHTAWDIVIHVGFALTAVGMLIRSGWLWFHKSNKVWLTGLPPGFLDGLDEEDQRAISEIVGKQVRLNEYDAYGNAELEFKDNNGVTHFIFVDPKFITHR